MFGGTDLNDFKNADPFTQFILNNTFGRSNEVRQSASPIHYVTPDDSPFLILHGTDDTTVPPRQSEKLAQSLQRVDVPVTLIKVEGAGHDLNTPGENPSPDQLTRTVVDFFVRNLR
jgi:dipeptidyl aminopeptidase/acylaminoacyl peptidase